MGKFLSGEYRNYRIADIQKNIRYYPLDVMLVGATGVGKSSTVNSLLKDERARIGYSVDPETVEIQDYMLNDYIRLWDTPGVGDNPEKDRIYFKKIEKFLNRKVGTDEGEATERKVYLIDLVVVLIDGSNRDNGTIIKLLNEVILKNITANRVLIAVNQADIAMKGRHWLDGNPDVTLDAFLQKKIISIQKRLNESTKKHFKKPIFYSAKNNFNVYSLLDCIIDNVHFTKRRSLNKKTISPKKAGKEKFNEFNNKKQEIYELLKESSPNEGSCDDKDCGYNNCLALAMRIAAGKDEFDLCPYIENDEDDTDDLFNVVEVL
jgi:predicted GTPase